MTGRLLDPGRTPHRCDPPGWWVRRKLGVLDGAIWECECGVRWKWHWDRFDGRMCWMCWMPHYPKPVEPPTGGSGVSANPRDFLADLEEPRYDTPEQRRARP